MKALGCILLFGIIFLPGCNRIVNWGKSNVFQGQKIKYTAEKNPSYIRSIVLYDQLKTLATFDALWLSDPVRTAYVDMVSLRTAAFPVEKKALLAAELLRNKNKITFYFLASYFITVGGLCDDWAVFLRIDNNNYQLEKISKVELLPEYKYFLRKVFSKKFKISYEVSFLLPYEKQVEIFTEGKHVIQLVFRSTQKEVLLSWHIMVHADLTWDLYKQPLEKIVRNR